MPLVFRAMRDSEIGPAVDHIGNDALGIREQMILESGQVVGDIPCLDGRVYPNAGGMSVSPSIGDLPSHLIPQRFRDRYPRARRTIRKPETFPWRYGSGEFSEGPLCPDLRLAIDSPTHGLVEPDKEMLLDELRLAIEATRGDWTREDW